MQIKLNGFFFKRRILCYGESVSEVISWPTAHLLSDESSPFLCSTFQETLSYKLSSSLANLIEDWRVKKRSQGFPHNPFQKCLASSSVPVLTWQSSLWSQFPMGNLHMVLALLNGPDLWVLETPPPPSVSLALAQNDLLLVMISSLSHHLFFDLQLFHNPRNSDFLKKLLFERLTMNSNFLVRLWLF